LFLCVAARDRYVQSQPYEAESVRVRIIQPERYCETHLAPLVSQNAKCKIQKKKSIEYIIMTKSLIAASALALTLSTPVLADPALGFGLNFTFQNGDVNTGVGIRAFSDDEQDKAAASVGLDYMFGSESWRGSLGAAYMMDNSYIELNRGYDFNSGVFEFGVGIGWSNTTDGYTAPVEEMNEREIADLVCVAGSECLEE
jgi:hypothetical protein